MITLHLRLIQSMNYVIVILVLLGFPDFLFAEDAKGPKTAELTAFWAEVSRSVHEGDFEAYVATCHPDGVLVSGVKKSSSPLSEALARWKKEFTATRSGEMKANVEFRFSRRFGDETTAHETGIFFYSGVAPDGKKIEEYIHFEILLVKTGGSWKTLMEYQKSKATPQEWEALGHG
jgi:hypothetical protein